MMDVIGIIPARYASSRFEGKVLAKIFGKPLIQYVWESARKARILDDVVIACDHETVAQAARKFGARVVMTSKDHVSGTDRIAEVVNPLDARIVLNIQGDEPLIHPSMIEDAARALLEDTHAPMATIMKRIDDPQALDDANVVKVVTDKNGYALYFSRSRIPYTAAHAAVKAPRYYKHIGLYAYTKDFLFTFKNLPVSRLEQTERLEQLRVLEEGFRIKVVETSFDTIGVDTPEDLERVKQYMEAHSGS